MNTSASNRNYSAKRITATVRENFCNCVKMRLINTINADFLARHCIAYDTNAVDIKLVN